MEKVCVDSGVDSTVSKGNIRKHSGIPRVINWCYYNKSNTKLLNWATYDNTAH